MDLLGYSNVQREHPQIGVLNLSLKRLTIEQKLLLTTRGIDFCENE